MVTELNRVVDERLLYDDGFVLVFNKPSGMQTHGSSYRFIQGAQDIVRQLKGDSWSAMHRLDRDTSGLVIFGNGPHIAAILQKQFASRNVRKSYLAIVEGDFSPKILGIIAPLRHYPEEKRVKVEISPEAKKAASSFQLMDIMKDNLGQVVSALRVRTHTGRTHQIRAHLSYLGYPIVGDPWYNPDPVVGSQRLLLHAQEICFTHPVTGEPVTFTSQVPEDFLLSPD